MLPLSEHSQAALSGLSLPWTAQLLEGRDPINVVSSPGVFWVFESFINGPLMSEIICEFYIFCFALHLWDPCVSLSVPIPLLSVEDTCSQACVCLRRYVHLCMPMHTPHYYAHITHHVLRIPHTQNSYNTTHTTHLYTYHTTHIMLTYCTYHIISNTTHTIHHPHLHTTHTTYYISHMHTHHTKHITQHINTLIHNTPDTQHTHTIHTHHTHT